MCESDLLSCSFVAKTWFIKFGLTILMFRIFLSSNHLMYLSSVFIPEKIRKYWGAHKFTYTVNNQRSNQLTYYLLPSKNGPKNHKDQEVYRENHTDHYYFQFQPKCYYSICSWIRFFVLFGNLSIYCSSFTVFKT